MLSIRVCNYVALVHEVVVLWRFGGSLGHLIAFRSFPHPPPVPIPPEVVGTKGARVRDLQVDPSEKGHEGAGLYANDTCTLDLVRSPFDFAFAICSPFLFSPARPSLVAVHSVYEFVQTTVNWSTMVKDTWDREEDK